jgi:hypothetical protein
MRLSTHPKWGMFKNASPVLKPLEGKATATGTGGAYGGVREQGPGADLLARRSASARRGEAALRRRQRTPLAAPSTGLRACFFNIPP